MSKVKLSGKDAEFKKSRKDDASARANISLVGRGNTGLQTDHFVTYSEKDERKKKVMSFSFA